MNIDINLQSGVPIYIQLTDQIKHQVAVGELKPGDQLPTVRQLAADLRVNFNTIARSYRLLDEAGIISTQHGRGTFILELKDEEETEKLKYEDLAGITRQYLTEANRLGYEPKDVRKVFENKMDLWIDTGTPPTPEDDSNGK